MEIRSTTISVSKGKAQAIHKHEAEIKQQLDKLDKIIRNSQHLDNIDGILKQYDDLKKELQHQYENKGKASIFRSKCRWLEKGEFKATKYFFNLEKRNQQCVVYNYKCDLCDAEYVGYTSRHLHQRIDEHRYSAIGKHLKNDHALETIGDLSNNFSVLKKCNGKLDNLIYEMLFIKKKRPCLNTQSDSIRAKLVI